MKKMIIPVLLFTLFYFGCSNPASEVSKVTVSYDSQGGSAVSSQQVEPGETVEILPVSEKFSYHFGGWYTEAKGGGEKFLADTVVEADITVYASWIQTAVVTTLAGSGKGGSSNGTGAAASFNNPIGVTVDSAGNLYIADYSNNLIRKMTASGVVTILAGSGTSGKDNGTGTAASFNGPNGIAVDSAGNVYVSELKNNLIRKITPAGVVTTLAGSGASGSNNGIGTAASFDLPFGIAVDSSGTVYVADAGNDLIRKITPAGVVTTLAGSGVDGKNDGTGTAASFDHPEDVAIDNAGNLYVADNSNDLIRKISPAGVVTTLAGSGEEGFNDGVGTAATFSSPSGIAVDRAGNMYVADTSYSLIRKISPAGVVTTLAGSGTSGRDDGAGPDASFNNPYGVVVDSTGTVFVADTLNHLIRKITQ